MTFAKYVKLETIVAAGFNYWEPSYHIDSQRGDIYVAYATALPNKRNLVILERKSDPEEFYVKTFPGKPLGEYNEQEAKAHLEIVKGAVQKRYAVAGTSLDNKIQSAVDASYKSRRKRR